MKIFSLGKFSKNIIYPLLLSIFSFLNFQAYMLITIKGKLQAHPFEILFLYSLGDILCGALEIVIHMRKKSRKKRFDFKEIHNDRASRISSISPTIHLPAPNENEYYYLVITIFMIILGILKLGAGVLFVFQYIYTKNVVLEIFGAIRILFTSILCYFLFKIKIYRHHLVSIIFIFIGVILAGVYPLIKFWNYFGISYFVFTICELIINSFLEVIEKYIMHFKYMSPYKILLLEGFVTLCYNSALLSILSFVKCPSHFEPITCKNYLVNVSEFFQIITDNKISILYIFLYIISVSLLNIFRIMTNKTFTPTHRTVADALTSIYLWIFGIFIFTLKKDLSVAIFQLTGYLIVLVGCLTYHEVLIWYCCKMEFNTKQEIDKRAKAESDLIQKDEEKLYNESDDERIIPKTEED